MNAAEVRELADDGQQGGQRANKSLVVVICFAVTVFLSAFLLFQVQPLISRFILPWFGGSPAVWTTCMLFFQSVLFLGYTYAHVLVSRLGSRGQMVVHLGLLAAAAAVLPITPGPEWKPAGDASPLRSLCPHRPGRDEAAA